MKLLKFFTLVLFIFIFSINFVYATNQPTLNLTTNTDASSNVQTVNYVEEQGLTTSNIINIILISVGVVLILLAVAILIRL